MRKSSTLCVAVNEDGVATVSLDRAEVRNALNPTLIGELTKTIEELSSDAGVRIIVLRGEGPVFCAGADLNWLRDVSGQSKEEVSIDSQRLQRLFTVLNQSPKLTIARIHGAAMAGGGWLGGLLRCRHRRERRQVFHQRSEVGAGAGSDIRISLGKNRSRPFALPLAVRRGDWRGACLQYRSCACRGEEHGGTGPSGERARGDGFAGFARRDRYMPRVARRYRCRSECWLGGQGIGLECVMPHFTGSS